MTTSAAVRVRRGTLALVAGLASALAACRPAPEPPPISEEQYHALVEECAAQAKQLGETLVGELKAAIEKGGPEGAVGVCGEAAARVAAENAKRGLNLRRTTLRLRNPENAPDAWERPILERWERERPAVVPAVATAAVEGPAGWEFRFLAPIFVQGLCTDCHGDPAAMKEGVRAALRAKYPEDRATGFAQGDLRGGISVRVPIRR